MTISNQPQRRPRRVSRLAHLEALEVAHAGEGEDAAIPAAERGELVLLRTLRGITDALAAGHAVPSALLDEADSETHRLRLQTLEALERPVRALKSDIGGSFDYTQLRELSLLRLLRDLVKDVRAGSLTGDRARIARETVHGAAVYENREGWRVDLLRDDGQTAEYANEDGGFVERCSSHTFHALFRPVSTLPFRRGTVTADWLDGPMPCWSDGRNVNGWGTPHFEHAQADALIARLGGRLRWDGNRIIDEGGEGQEGGVCQPHILPDCTFVWGIGAGAWMWDQVQLADEKETLSANAFRVADVTIARLVAACQHSHHWRPTGSLEADCFTLPGYKGTWTLLFRIGYAEDGMGDHVSAVRSLALTALANGTGEVGMTWGETAELINAMLLTVGDAVEAAGMPLDASPRERTLGAVRIADVTSAELVEFCEGAGGWVRTGEWYSDTFVLRSYHDDFTVTFGLSTAARWDSDPVTGFPPLLLTLGDLRIAMTIGEAVELINGLTRIVSRGAFG